MGERHGLDLLAGGGALFELKAVDAPAEPRRRQLMQHLFRADPPRGEPANLRAERVRHEFVNNARSPSASVPLPMQRYSAFRADLRSSLDRADLRAIQRINVTQPEVRFEAVWKGS